MLAQKPGGSVRREGWIAVLVGLGAAGGALAASKGAAPPPATMDAKGIDDWRKAHIETAGGWALLFADGAALSYAGGPNGVVRDKDGFLQVDIRREYYKTVRLGPQASRSNLQTWLLDCDARRVRVTAMNFYVLNNMKGNGFRKSAEEASWAAVDPSDFPLVDRICAAAAR
jgi:hypothetical protein